MAVHNIETDAAWYQCTSPGCKYKCKIEKNIAKHNAKVHQVSEEEDEEEEEEEMVTARNVAESESAVVAGKSWAAFLAAAASAKSGTLQKKKAEPSPPKAPKAPKAKPAAAKPRPAAKPPSTKSSYRCHSGSKPCFFRCTTRKSLLLHLVKSHRVEKPIARVMSVTAEKEEGGE